MWCVTELRNYLYNRRMIKSVRFDFPIISIGNLSVGGTGKSPHTEHLLQLLLYTHQVATLSRGYGRKSVGFKVVQANSLAAEVGDEPLMFKQKHPDAIVTVGEDRVDAIPEILQMKPDLDVILLDDAYQHRGVRPGLSILLTTYKYPFYKDELFPVGQLRESKANYKRADILVVTQCPTNLSPVEKQNIIYQLKPKPHQKVYFTTYHYGQLYSLYDFNWKYDLHKDTIVLLLCGIANPHELMQHIQQQVTTVHLRQFADHHTYDLHDMDSIRETWSHIGDKKKVLITTEKDAVRLLPHRDWLLANKIEAVIQPIQVKFLFNEGKQFDNDVINYIVWEKNQTIA